MTDIIVIEANSVSWDDVDGFGNHVTHYQSEDYYATVWDDGKAIITDLDTLEDKYINIP